MPVRLAAFAALLVSSSLFAQTVTLSEQLKPGECFGYELTLKLDGSMKLYPNGKMQTLPMTGEAGIKFVERVESPDAAGGAGKVVRYYTEAKGSNTFGGEMSKRELSAERRLTVAVRTETETVHVCPNGPFTRDELDLVGDHFDTLALPLLLPNKEIKIGETWTVSDSGCQHALLFDGLAKNNLKGTLTGVKDGVATFTIVGTAEGVEMAAGVKVSVSATGTYDIKAGQITGLVWEQSDERERGPVSPETEVKAKWVVKRVALADEPKELKAEAGVKVPEKLTAELTRLRHAAAKYTLTYPRDWMTVANTPDHFLLRLLDAGEPVCQATVSVWKKAGKGEHSTPTEFKELIARVPGWEATEALGEGEVKTEGKWVYRWSGKGKQNGTPVVQTFYLIAAPSGEQVTMTFLCSPDKATKTAEREKDVIEGVSFPEKK
ncbi:MAG: hypothetical protein MUF18_07885 [Fimbriiglobus sp.]|jgi:hypothetical protein|nr:hypothetical protein [Fimbriiglobus sp.]